MASTSAPAMNESGFALRTTTTRTRPPVAAARASSTTSASRRMVASVSTLSFRSGSSNVIQPIPRASMLKVGVGLGLTVSIPADFRGSRNHARAGAPLGSQGE
jgi:hypothetical protein